MVCNSGVGLTPKVEGRLLHLSPGGLYNGLILLVDDETRSYWDHITGEAVDGAMTGARMERWPIEVTTVRAALAQAPAAAFARSEPPTFDTGRVLTKIWSKRMAKSAVFPVGFKRTMSAADARRPEMETGVGVVVGQRARYYPMDEVRRGITDRLEGRRIRLELCQTAGMPVARWEDEPTSSDEERPPFQLLTRWYGFSRTYPSCEIYGEGGEGDAS